MYLIRFGRERLEFFEVFACQSSRKYKKFTETLIIHRIWVPSARDSGSGDLPYQLYALILIVLLITAVYQ